MKKITKRPKRVRVEWRELKIFGHNEPDFCFKSYHAKDKKDSYYENFQFVARILDRFPILQMFLN